MNTYTFYSIESLNMKTDNKTALPTRFPVNVSIGTIVARLLYTSLRSSAMMRDKFTMSSEFRNSNSTASINMQNQKHMQLDFTPPSSVQAGCQSMLNRQRLYAGDFESMSEFFLESTLGVREEVAKDFTSLKTFEERQITKDELHIHLSKSRLFTDDFDRKFDSIKQGPEIDEATPTDSIHTFPFTEIEPSADLDSHSGERKLITFAQKLASACIDRFSASVKEYGKEIFKSERAANIGERISRTEESTPRESQDGYRDAPPDQSVQQRQQRISARFAAPQNEQQPEPVLWTENKHWNLCLVKETDLHVQFELRQAGEKACLTLFDEEAYFALVALIDYSENPGELVFELSSRNSVVTRATHQVAVYNLRLLLELKQTRIKLNTSDRNAANHDWDVELFTNRDEVKFYLKKRGFPGTMILSREEAAQIIQRITETCKEPNLITFHTSLGGTNRSVPFNSNGILWIVSGSSHYQRPLGTVMRLRNILGELTL